MFHIKVGKTQRLCVCAWKWYSSTILADLQDKTAKSAPFQSTVALPMALVHCVKARSLFGLEMRVRIFKSVVHFTRETPTSSFSLNTYFIHPQTQPSLNSTHSHHVLKSFPSYIFQAIRTTSFSLHNFQPSCERLQHMREQPHLKSTPFSIVRLVFSPT